MPSRTRDSAWAVALGGAAGATCRWALAAGFSGPGDWPGPTLAANVAGCLVLGVVAARVPFAAARSRVVLWRDGLGTGFCGGLTTFSTFAVEAAELLRDHRAALALAYLVVSVVSGYAVFELGRRWARAGGPGGPGGHVDDSEVAA